MIIMLTIVLIGAILYGYLLMRNLDQYINKGFFNEEPEILCQKDILLYGESETIKIIGEDLDKVGILYDVTDQPTVKEETKYRWVGAFSKDDMSNLLICMGGKRKNASIHTMARCNHNMYKNVFKQMDITVIVEQDVSAKQILSYLRGEKVYDVFKKD